MNGDRFFEMLWEEREGVFSGIGITVLTSVWWIVKSICKKKSVDKTDANRKIQKIVIILLQEVKTLLVIKIVLRKMIIVM